MTQQTLEEVAKEIYKGEYVCNGIDIVPIWREGFIYGAKWQQEQDKNNYNEQDMITAIQYTINNFFNGKLAGLNSEEIFEQFKNK
jgi:hypothetical protein